MADQIRVLIVDDIQETRDHLTKLLGFETDVEVVGAAASGADALAMATSLQPDVVLMDINMPDMDGIATTWPSWSPPPSPPEAPAPLADPAAAGATAMRLSFSCSRV